METGEAGRAVHVILVQSKNAQKHISTTLHQLRNINGG